MTGRFPSRPCPLCGNEDRDFVFRQSFHPVAHDAFMEGYDVVVCRSCGFGFADRVPPQAAFDAYYAGVSNYENVQRDGVETAEDADRFRTIAEVVAAHLPSTEARILEVGCSTGALLAVLRARGFRNVEGLDPSPACARTAARLHGVQVTTGTLFGATLAQRRADMVVLVGVLEHLVDAGRAAGRLRELCAPEGSVYVEVPDATLFASCIDAPFQQFSTEHLGFFSPATLTRLMGQHGFRTLSCSQTVRAHTSNSRMPVIAGVFQVTSSSPEPRGLDPSVGVALRSYISRSTEVEVRMHDAIRHLVESGEPVLVWGLGTLTRRLLVTSGLREANIRAFVDSNPRLWGEKVEGIPVLGPEDVRSRPETILLASVVFADEITRQIRVDLGCPNSILPVLA